MDAMIDDLVRQHGQTLAAGQVAEFKVWAELMRQSAGGLHVFLPLRDMGIDAVIHRLSDGAYIPVQVKGRSELTRAGQVHITVTASSLVDDDALLVATLLDGDRLGAMVLVIAEADFRRLAAHDMVDGREYLTAAFEMHADGLSRWAPHLVDRGRLGERFGATAVEGLEPAESAGGVDRREVGFLGESEVIRRLAEAPELNLFRPFPDLETVELLARHVGSRRFLGLQVKASGWDEGHMENRVHFRRSSFRPADSTYVVILGWNRTSRDFGQTCLLIPSRDVIGMARAEGEWLVIELQPGSDHHRQLDTYRTPLPSLGLSVAQMLE
jgi:hypothetical protein